MASKLTTAAIQAFAENSGNPPLVRTLAKLCLEQRTQLVKTRDSKLDIQVRDLTAENKRLRIRIAELESKGE